MKNFSILLLGFFLAGCSVDDGTVNKLVGTTFWVTVSGDNLRANPHQITTIVSTDFLHAGAASAGTAAKADWAVSISQSLISQNYLQVVVKYHGSVALQGDYPAEVARLEQEPLETDLSALMSCFRANKCLATATCTNQ